MPQDRTNLSTTPSASEGVARVGELAEALVIATEARRREPALPEETARAVLTAPIPTERARYDLILLPTADQEDPGGHRLRRLVAEFARAGHRVFSLGATEPDPVDPGPGLIELPLADAPAGSAEDRAARLLDALASARRENGIEAAAVFVGSPGWADLALRLRERWGWRLVYDATNDQPADPARDGDQAGRLWREADVVVGSAATPDGLDAGSGPRWVGLGELDAPTAGWEAVDRAIRAAFPPASIVVLTTNLLAYFRLCVASILANTDYPNYELIVVDNATTDGTEAYLRDLQRQHPHVRVLRNERTRSFAENNNLGLAAATGDVLVLLNDDTMLARGWLTRLARSLEDPSLGLVGPATNRTCNEAQIDAPYATYGEFVRFAREQAVAHEGELVPIRMLAMFCTALRRDAYERIGPLDERYQVGMFEDEDYVLRLKAAGYGVAWARDVYVHHHYHATVGQLLPTGEYSALAAANQRRIEEKSGIC